MEYFRLEEVATFVNGYAFSREKYKDRGIPIIRISDIDEEIKLGNCICYPEKSLEKLKEYTVKKGSLLIALSGATTGKMGVFNSDRIAYLNQRICSIFSKDKNLLQEYLIFYLKNLKEIILKNSYGGAQPNISSKWLEKRVIGIPSLTEQKKIVVILDKLVTTINKKKKQINLLEELVKSRFIEMFGDPIKNEKGWEESYLKNLSVIIMGQSPPSNSYNNIGKGLPFYQGNIDFGDKYPKLNKFCSEPLKIAKKKSILMSVRAPVGEINITNWDCCIGRGLCSLELKESLNIEYLYNYLKNIIVTVKSKSKGSTFKSINKLEIENIKVLLPSLSLQNEFAEFVTKTNKLKFEVEKSLKEMENLYESLMQKFFKQN